MNRFCNIVVGVTTALTVLTTAFLAVAGIPWVTHFDLTQAGSAQLLGATESQVNAWSDATISRLLWSGSFRSIPGFGGPFYTQLEANHLADVRTHLIVLGVATAACLCFTVPLILRVRNHQLFRAAAKGAWTVIIGVILLALVGLVNFNAGFGWMHEVLFPEGNYSFSYQSHMIELYPDGFWQLIGVQLGIVMIVLSCIILLAEAFNRPVTPAKASPEKVTATTAT